MTVTSTSALTNDEQDLLRFLLNLTAERWTAETEDQIQYVADDPSIDSMDHLLDTTKSLADLPRMVLSIRDKLFPREVSPT